MTAAEGVAASVTVRRHPESQYVEGRRSWD